MGKFWAILGHSWRQLIGIATVVGVVVGIATNPDASALATESWALMLAVLSLPIVFGPALLLLSAGLGFAVGRVFERRSIGKIDLFHERLSEIASKTEALCHRIKRVNETDSANQSDVRSIRALFIDLRSIGLQVPDLDASEVRNIFADHHDAREAYLFCCFAFDYIDRVRHYLTPTRFEAGRHEATKAAKDVDQKLKADIDVIRSAAEAPGPIITSAYRAALRRLQKG